MFAPVRLHSAVLLADELTSRSIDVLPATVP
jgi:hypothetical protein